MIHYPQFLSLAHGILDFPVFLPDATFGMVRHVDSNDLIGVGIQGVVMNTFHLNRLGRVPGLFAHPPKRPLRQH